jgi:hypothetical protein
VSLESPNPARQVDHGHELDPRLLVQLLDERLHVAELVGQQDNPAEVLEEQGLLPVGGAELHLGVDQ